MLVFYELKLLSLIRLRTWSCVIRFVIYHLVYFGGVYVLGQQVNIARHIDVVRRCYGG